MAKVWKGWPVGLEDVKPEGPSTSLVFEGPLGEAIKKYEELRREQVSDGHALIVVDDSGKLVFACS